MDAWQKHSPLDHATHPFYIDTLVLSRPRVNQQCWPELPLSSIPLGKYQSVLGPSCLLALARLLRTRPRTSGLSPKPSSLHRAHPPCRRGFLEREVRYPCLGSVDTGAHRPVLTGLTPQWGQANFHFP